MRKILITGASNGLGFALAEHFLSNGETVVINTRTPTTAELTEKKIVANKFKGKFEIQIIFDILSASKSITFPS